MSNIFQTTTNWTSPPGLEAEITVTKIGYVVCLNVITNDPYVVTTAPINVGLTQFNSQWYTSYFYHLILSTQHPVSFIVIPR